MYQAIITSISSLNQDGTVSVKYNIIDLKGNIVFPDQSVITQPSQVSIAIKDSLNLLNQAKTQAALLTVGEVIS